MRNWTRRSKMARSRSYGISSWQLRRIECLARRSLFGAKWRSWKVMHKELDTQGGPIREYGIPASYDLHLDPREERPLDPTSPSLWDGRTRVASGNGK